MRQGVKKKIVRRTGVAQGFAVIAPQQRCVRLKVRSADGVLVDEAFLSVNLSTAAGRTVLGMAGMQRPVLGVSRAIAAGEEEIKHRVLMPQIPHQHIVGFNTWRRKDYCVGLEMRLFERSNFSTNEETEPWHRDLGVRRRSILVIPAP